MVKGIINAFDPMALCFVINLTKDGNWAITWPPIFATGYVSFAATFLARLFSKKTSRHCHSPGVVVGVVARCRAKTLTFSIISVITKDIYLKLRIVVHYQKGKPYQ